SRCAALWVVRASILAPRTKGAQIMPTLSIEASQNLESAAPKKGKTSQGLLRPAQERIIRFRLELLVDFLQRLFVVWPHGPPLILRFFLLLQDGALKIPRKVREICG